MKVIVTKDIFGIAIWKHDAELTYENRFSNSPKVKTWMAKNCIFQTQKLVMSRKRAKVMFSDFEKTMNEGDILNAEIVLKVI